MKFCVHDEVTVLEGVQIGLDEEEIGTRFYGKKTGPGYIYSMSPGEMFNGSTDGRFQLDYFDTGVFDAFVVDTDVEVALRQF